MGIKMRREIVPIIKVVETTLLSKEYKFKLLKEYSVFCAVCKPKNDILLSCIGRKFLIDRETESFWF